MAHRVRKRPTRKDLEKDGPPVRLPDLAHLAGFSTQKLLKDVESGDLMVKWAKAGQRRRGMVDRAEARRYMAVLYGDGAVSRPSDGRQAS
jgi:hypothetical protein